MIKSESNKQNAKNAKFIIINKNITIPPSANTRPFIYNKILHPTPLPTKQPNPYLSVNIMITFNNFI